MIPCKIPSPDAKKFSGKELGIPDLEGIVFKDDFGVAVRTFWSPSPAEMEAIKNGAYVMLDVYHPGQPPVAVNVCDPKLFNKHDKPMEEASNVVNDANLVNTSRMIH